MSGRPKHDFSETSHFLKIKNSKTLDHGKTKGLACHGHAAMRNTHWTSMTMTLGAPYDEVIFGETDCDVVERDWAKS